MFEEQRKIINKKELLSIEYNPERIIGRKKELKELIFQFSYFFREFPSLPQMIIYGNVGTGKTCCLKYIITEFEKECRKKEVKNLKIVYVKGSECRTKYEILKKIYESLTTDNTVAHTSSDLHSEIVSILADRGYAFLLVIDEIHELRDVDKNDTLFTISRLGEDISYAKSSRETLTESKKSIYGYVLISNDHRITSKLKENTKSSLTREALMFNRYTPEEIVEILQDRINQGALVDNSLDEDVLQTIAAESVKWGQDARYALLLLLNTAKEAEKYDIEKIDVTLVKKMNSLLQQDYLKSLIRDQAPFYIEILSIIYDLAKADILLNSKTVWEEYEKRIDLQRVNYSRISQIITEFEKNNIIYVCQSKKTKLRNLSIEENLPEIEEVLRERGKI